MEQAEQKREFLGVWIPKEIWLNPDLSAIEKCIYTEINSLDNEDGCHAGNDYLATFCGCSEATVTRAISKLKDMGYIEVVSFDGRHRVLHSMLKYQIAGINKNSIVNLTSQDNQNDEAPSAKCKAIKLDNNIKNNKSYSKESSIPSSDNEELQRIKKELSIDEPTENPELSESYKSFLGSATNKKTSKRPNRFQQCINLIDEFTDDESVRTLLVQYLRLRFESASAEGKPIYVNQWRGLLTKLMNIVKQGNDIKEVIQQSIDRGYRSFFPVNSSKKYAANNYTNEPLASEAYKDIPDEERDPRFGTGEVF